MNWFAAILHFLGVEPRSPSTAYNWWSGAGSDLGEVAIFAGVVGLYRKHNCEVAGCKRLGRHDTAGGHTVCSKHHPDGAPSAQDVVDAHELAKVDQ